MANLCGNFLTVTGGTKENLQELSSKFLDLPDEEGFDSIFDVNSFKLIDDSGGFSIVFTTNWSPATVFVINLSHIYQVNVELTFLEPGCNFGGMLKARSGDIKYDLTMPYNEWCYFEDPENFLKVEGDDLVYYAIEYDSDIEDFEESLYYMTEKDREYLLSRFRERSSVAIES